MSNGTATLTSSLRGLVRRFDTRPRYNYTWSTRSQFVYVRVAKVATRSVTAWLNEQLDDEPTYLSGRPMPRDPQREIFVFGFVRNPWDRLVSCWLNKVAGGKPYWAGTPLDGLEFPAFVHHIAGWDLDRCDRHVRRQTALLPQSRMDMIGRFEDLETGISTIATKIGVDATAFPKRNTSTDRAPLASYFDDELWQLVGELYQPDVDAFGYDDAVRG